MDEGFFQGFANALVEGVQRELTARGIPLLISSDELSADRLAQVRAGVHQVTVLDNWPGEVEVIPAREFAYHYLRNWAIEMGLKLARPGVLSTYRMELPRGVSAAAIGRTEDLVIRCVVDYSIREDSEILRVDALAKWDE